LHLELESLSYFHDTFQPSDCLSLESCSFFCSGIGILASFKKNKVLLIATVILILALIVAQFGLGLKGVVMGGNAWENELFSSWMNASFTAREYVENTLNCCGYYNSTDEIPTGWDDTCQGDYSKQSCCALPPSLAPENWNATILNGTTKECGVNETKLDCCGYPDSCVTKELRACQDVLGSILEERLGIIAAIAIVFTLIELIGLLITALLTYKLWSAFLPSPNRLLDVSITN